MGDRPLKEAMFGLQEAQVMHDIGRQKVADARLEELYNLGLPGAQLQSEQDQQALKERNEPMRLGGFMQLGYGTRPSPETVSYTLANNYFEDFLKTANARYDKENDLFIRNSDNSIVTKADKAKFAPLMQIVIAAKANPGHAAKQTYNKLVTSGQNFRPGSPEYKFMREWEEAIKDPSRTWLRGAYEKQKQMNQKSRGVLAQMGVTDFGVLDKSDSDIDRKIAGIDKANAETLKHQRAKELKQIGLGGKGKGFEFKASDSNSIGRQVARLFHFEWSEDDQDFLGVTDEDRTKGAAIHALAEQKFVVGQGKITHAQAVSQAAKDYGIKIPSSEKDVNAFIDKQLGRYGDLTGKKADQPPAATSDMMVSSHEPAKKEKTKKTSKGKPTNTIPVPEISENIEDAMGTKFNELFQKAKDYKLPYVKFRGNDVYEARGEYYIMENGKLRKLTESESKEISPR
jgi:hypothetical protein